jgi:hypothetical protein
MKKKATFKIKGFVTEDGLTKLTVEKTESGVFIQEFDISHTEQGRETLIEQNLLFICKEDISTLLKLLQEAI